MDARAFRMGLKDTHFFEVDQETLFSVKEPLLRGQSAQCASRSIIAGDLTDPRHSLLGALRESGFDKAVPTCWLIEGLIMYLSPRHVDALLAQIDAASAPGSAVVHDAVSETSHRGGIECCGARFLSGNDDYAGLWNRHGFGRAEVLNFAAIRVNRYDRRLEFNRRSLTCKPQWVQGRPTTFF